MLSQVVCTLDLEIYSAAPVGDRGAGLAPSWFSVTTTHSWPILGVSQLWAATTQKRSCCVQLRPRRARHVRARRKWQHSAYQKSGWYRLAGCRSASTVLQFLGNRLSGCARFARLLGNQLTEITPACLESVIAYLHHSASAQAKLDSLARPSCAASQQGQYIACRAYKLGRGRWSYNQCELSLHQDGTESRSSHRLSALKAIYQKDVSA